jgi:hypothetical protein
MPEPQVASPDSDVADEQAFFSDTVVVQSPVEVSIEETDDTSAPSPASDPPRDLLEVMEAGERG